MTSLENVWIRRSNVVLFRFISGIMQLKVRKSGRARGIDGTTLRTYRTRSSTRRHVFHTLDRRVDYTRNRRTVFSSVDSEENLPTGLVGSKIYYKS